MYEKNNPTRNANQRLNLHRSDNDHLYRNDRKKQWMNLLMLVVIELDSPSSLVVVDDDHIDRDVDHLDEGMKEEHKEMLTLVLGKESKKTIVFESSLYHSIFKF